MKKMNAQSIIVVLRRTMDLIDKRLANHGSRVAYLLYHMLKLEGKYSQEELEHFFMIALLHDIGAYKTDEIDTMLTYDCKSVWSHSIYGFLYLKYLSPLEEYACIVLYHHLDYYRFAGITDPYREISMYLNIADRVDIYMLYNRVFKKEDFEESREKRFCGNGLDLFYRADAAFDLLKKMKTGAYEDELDELIRGITFSEETCRRYLRLLCFTIDFRRDDTIVRTANTNIFSIGLCRLLHLSEESEYLMYYASILYDIGMLAIPRRLLDAPRSLTDAERIRMQQHIPIMLKTFEGIVPDEILSIAGHHHERLNGSGYPFHLDETALSTLDRILEISDVVGSLSCANTRRGAFDADEIIRILSIEAMQGTLDKNIIKVAIQNKDTLFDRATEIHKNAFEDYYAIKEQYDTIIQQFEKFN